MREKTCEFKDLNLENYLFNITSKTKYIYLNKYFFFMFLKAIKNLYGI